MWAASRATSTIAVDHPQYRLDPALFHCLAHCGSGACHG
jgi:hypothetical protein